MQIVEDGVTETVSGHTWSLDIVSLDGAYDKFLLAFPSNCVTNSHRFWDVVRYWF